VAKRRRKSGTSRSGKGVKPPRPSADNARSTLMGSVELSDIRRLIRLVQRTGIGELEVSAGDRSVRISANAQPGAVAIAPAASPERPRQEAGAAAKPEPASPPRNTVTIPSPMVGTFYSAPAPDADPYVEVGHRVDVGTTVCIIEAMKLMNEIESEVSGRIVEVLVENAQPVEYGQALFLVEPA
jgi:acetyl-CoA carboxylase biotin carboxyl carrier protein